MPSEQLIQARDSGGGEDVVGSMSITGGAGPGGHGSVVVTRGWDSTLKRQRRRDLVTGTGVQNYQSFSGLVAQHDPSAFFPLQGPPNGLIYRIRDCVAAEYVSGGGILRVGFGVGLLWSNLLRGAPGQPLDLGFIGFLWYQVGAVSTNWRAVAADHVGTNRFDVDTGKVAPGVPYNLRVDFDGRIGQRNITYFIDEVQVAQFTPGDNVLGGSSTAILNLFVGANAQLGNACAVHYEMLSDGGWEFLVQPGGPTT